MKFKKGRCELNFLLNSNFLCAHFFSRDYGIEFLCDLPNSFTTGMLYFTNVYVLALSMSSVYDCQTYLALVYLKNVS